MRRFAILLSPQGYEMSTGLPNTDNFEHLDEKSIKERVQLMYIFNHNGETISQNQLNIEAKKYKDSHYSKQNLEQNGFDVESQRMYMLRKKYAQVPGQIEFIFALNQEDMNWIYQRNPIDAGLILCELFMNTKTNEWVDKSIEGKNIIGINKCSEKYWDKVKYDLEDFYDLYIVKKNNLNKKNARK